MTYQIYWWTLVLNCFNNNGKKKWNFYFIVTKWLSTGTVINTLNNSHLSKRKTNFNIDLNHSLFFTYVRVCNPWCDTYNSARCRIQYRERERERKRMCALSSLLVGYMSRSLVLFLSFSLCTITICKVILSNWHEI